MSQQASKPKPKYLVVTSSNFFDLDKLASAIIWGKLLAINKNAKVDLYLGLPKLPRELAAIVSPELLNFKEKLETDYFTLTLDKNDAEIREVRWEEVGDKVKIMVFTDKGEIDSKDYSTHPGNPHYNELHAVGLKDKEKVLDTLGEFSDLWDRTRTVNIDIASKNKSYAQENILYPDRSSYADAIFQRAKEEGLEVPPELATEILSCIYWKTNSLRNKYASKAIFSSVLQLLELGASIQEASTKIFSSLSFIEVKARQEIYNNLKMTNQKYAFSNISKDTARSLLKTSPIFPNKNPLHKLSDIHASFVLVPISDIETLVLASSNDNSVSLKTLFSEYNYLGDNLQAEFIISGNMKSSEEKIKSILGTAKGELKEKQKQIVSNPEKIKDSVVPQDESGSEDPEQSPKRARKRRRRRKPRNPNENSENSAQTSIGTAKSQDLPIAQTPKTSVEPLSSTNDPIPEAFSPADLGLGSISPSSNTADPLPAASE